MAVAAVGGLTGENAQRMRSVIARDLQRIRVQAPCVFKMHQDRGSIGCLPRDVLGGVVVNAVAIHAGAGNRTERRRPALALQVDIVTDAAKRIDRAAFLRAVASDAIAARTQIRAAPVVELAPQVDAPAIL